MLLRALITRAGGDETVKGKYELAERVTRANGVFVVRRSGSGKHGVGPLQLVGG